MVKDYAKRRNYQPRSQRRKLILLILPIIILAFIFSLLFFYVKKPPHSHSQTKPISTATQAMPELTPPVAEQPQFDFYTLLPKMQVSVPKKENKEGG